MIEEIRKKTYMEQIFLAFVDFYGFWRGCFKERIGEREDRFMMISTLYIN